MAVIESLSSLLQVENNDHQNSIDYPAAVTFAFKIIETEESKSTRLWARDEITRPVYSTVTNRGVTVKNCPFLLGCLQAVMVDDGDRLQAWERQIETPKIRLSLQENVDDEGHPFACISCYEYAHATLACALAALAFKLYDFKAFFKYGYAASKWFAGMPPEEYRCELSSTSRVQSDHPIAECFTQLSETLKIPVGQARDLTEWFFEPTSHRQPKVQRKIWVPFFGEHVSGAAILEVDGWSGSGEWYPDPVTMAFRHWNSDFKDSQKNALGYLKETLRCWKKDQDVSWRFISWNDDYPLMELKGGSAGGAFLAALWHLQKGVQNDFSVTVSAAITNEGTLAPVTNIRAKLIGLNDFRKKGALDVSQVVVAKDQDGIDNRIGDLQISHVKWAADPDQHGCQKSATKSE